MSASGTGISRRKFLQYSAAACAATYLGWSQKVGQAAQPADMVLRNGNILTVDPADSIAQAVAIQGDKIMAVGTNEAVNALIGPSTEVIDLEGKTVTPGLIDSHVHPLYYGRVFWEGFLDVRYPKVKSLNDLLGAIQARAQASAPGQWISGNQGFYFSEGELEFDKTHLDLVAPHNPVYLRQGSGQYSVVNSQALAAGGIDAGGTITPNPFGGVIVRDPVTNEPTGVLLHYPAENLVMLKADGYRDLSDAEMENDILRAQALLLAAGITSAQDVIIGDPAHMKIYKNLADRGQLKMRTYMLLYVNTEQQAQNYAAQLHGVRTDYLTFAGWKLAIDGGVAAGTTAMYDTSLQASYRSYYYFQPVVLNRIVKTLHETGMQISFHIVGDKGIDQALNALEGAGAGVSTRRHRIEHALFIQPSSLARIKDLGVVMSLQPQWISWWADGYRQATNEASMANFMPLKTMLQEGIPLAFGCDVPASPYHDPKWAFIGATSRRTNTGYQPNPDQVLDMHEALRVHTMGSAYAAGEENIKGSIEVGKFADLVVWNDDLYAIDSMSRASRLTALMTIVGGEIVARAETSKVYLPFLAKNR